MGENVPSKVFQTEPGLSSRDLHTEQGTQEASMGITSTDRSIQGRWPPIRMRKEPCRSDIAIESFVIYRNADAHGISCRRNLPFLSPRPTGFGKTFAGKFMQERTPRPSGTPFSTFYSHDMKHECLGLGNCALGCRPPGRSHSLLLRCKNKKRVARRAGCEDVSGADKEHTAGDGGARSCHRAAFGRDMVYCIVITNHIVFPE
jgi:hypothetical protein